MKILHGVEAARSTLLRRSPLESQEIPPGLRSRIKEFFAEELTPVQVVERILGEVRSEGDAALFRYTERFDGVGLIDLEVTKTEISQSYAQVNQELVSALDSAAQRIRSFCLVHKRHGWIDYTEGGLGQIVHPLERVGIYIPGGSVCYPSTVLMTVIPAKVAGVKEIILTTPPGKEGAIPSATLVAIDIAKGDRAFKVGGAQAIAALAFGTDSIPKVDKICGPGNIFVQLAKKLVYGVVDIDGLYGPTEIVILADETANPIFCAADLLAQAEHDPLASAILITTSSKLATQVSQEIEQQLAKLERREIAAASLEEKGGIAVVEDMEEAIELVNSYAPEHLSLVAQDAWSYLDRIKNAGGIFIGESSPEVLGDYMAGPSHVMPTGGTPHFSSPLTVDDFLKSTSVAALNKETLKLLGPSAVTIAEAEGLKGHAQAVRVRLG
jgi:histidinol dehydrogenase